jgi:hypothetical protein
MKTFFALVLAMFVSVAQAQEFKPQVFEDQFGEPISLSASTQWLVFSYDKTGGDWVKQALVDLQINDIEARGGLYVADVSAMPSVITKLFALPKMRNYEFKMALDMSGDLTKDWPRTEGTVTLMRLNGLTVVEKTQANSPEQVKAFLSAF